MKICLLSFALCLYFAAGAQTLSGNGLQKEVYMGRVIQVIPAMGKGYGYKIFFMNHLVAYNNVNPFTMAPIGLRKQEDALAIARWHIRQMLGSPTTRVIKNKRFPRAIAAQLNIQIP